MAYIELDCNDEVWFPEETYHTIWLSWDIVDGHLLPLEQIHITRERAFERPYDIETIVQDITE